MAKKTTSKTKSKPKKKLDFEKEVAELHILLRALGEQAIMMRDGGKLAEKERTYFGDIVTEADRHIEQKLMQYLQSEHPDHRVRGEETGVVGPAESAYEWIVNPIDGTTNFSKGLEFFSIAVALLENNKPILGIIYLPELARFVYAVKGGGVQANGKPFTVFERPLPVEMSRALIAGATTRRKAARMPVLGAIRSHGMNLMNTGSMTYNCILLANRKIDAAVHTDATIFNIAAAIPIVEEAGGVVLGINQAYPDLTQESIPVIFASSQELAEDIKKHLDAHWGSEPL